MIGPAAATATGVRPARRPSTRTARSTVSGGPARAVATDLGIDLICRRDDLGAIADALADAGVERVDVDAAEIARVEAGRPRFGREMTTETIPQEAGINERAVSFTKGCYIGQETVARLHYRGKPNRHLRGLRLAEPVAAGDGVRLGDRELGRVGHRGPLPRARADRACGAAPGGRARGDGRGRRRRERGDVEAEVVELPFKA